MVELERKIKYGEKLANVVEGYLKQACSQSMVGLYKGVGERYLIQIR